MRLTPLARRLGTAALVVTLGAGFTACSGDSSSDDSTSSATDAGADDTSSASDSGEDAEAADDAPAELSAADFYPTVMGALRDAESFAFTSTSGTAGQTQEMAGQARFGDDGIEMKASGTGAQSMEMILVDKAMYMKSADLGTGDKWLKIDLSDPNSLFGMIGKATDPEVMFKALEEPKKLELIGAEDVDGVATNHYRITMDPTKYLEAMQFPAAMKDLMPEELVTDMWVDADDLPRKFSQTVEIPGVGGGEPTTSTTEGTYSDFGVDVEIEAPPADEVTEDMFGGA
ncbi:hypothetical protein [Nocardioides okcheonensis]|uniref:hypothetical protein n=1 Tax=Nocardioides okcheonensis TaxID=2894081 RepID=UPI001E318FBF|nr:hypothetical protein [Nocardioides okcheonensis]UFN43621.1 hypothetical protein LN652_16475 [Nocardioides okcheonensis]